MKAHHPATPKYLLITGAVFIIFSVIAVGALISNSTEAKRRYDVLIATDAAGGDVESALRDLREYMYAHMNTTIGSPNGVYPPIQLKATYDRLVAAEQERVRSANEQLYGEAQADCERRFPIGLSGSGRIPCITEYVSQRGVKEQPIADGLYKFNFVSPFWSPDLAGFALLASLGSGIYLILQIIVFIRLRRHIRHIS